MNVTAIAAPRTGSDTALFPYRFSLPRTGSMADLFVALGLFGDLCMVLTGLALGFWIRFKSGWITLGNESPTLTIGHYSGLIGLGSVLLLLAFGYLQLYNPRRIPSFRAAVLIVLKGTAFWTVAFLSLNLVMKTQPHVSRVYMATSFVTCLGTVLLWRWLYSQLLQTRPIAGTLHKRVLFVGWTPTAEQMLYRLADPVYSCEVVGWIPTPLGRRDVGAPPGLPELSHNGDLATLVKRHQIDTVVVADLGVAEEEIIGLVNLCERESIEFKIIPSHLQILLSGLKLESVNGTSLLGLRELPLNRLINRLIKRAVDVVVSLVAITLLGPLFLLLALLVKLDGGPIIFRQTRVGLRGREFKMFKFRSMCMDAEARLEELLKFNEKAQGVTFKMKDDPRVTKIGRILRKTSLDELPQFFNVLRGEMSLVGPRPPVPREVALYTEKDRRRFLAKPGITCLWQVGERQGGFWEIGDRNAIDFDEQVSLDARYIENQSFWRDLWILIKTVPAILVGKGA